jgi:hypothetical protein
MVTILCHFLTLMVLIRMLDKESMGAYFIALIIMMLLVLLSDMGVDLALVKKYPEEDETGKASLACLSLLIRFRGQNRRGINKLTALALAVEKTPQRVDDIGLSGPPPDLRG